MAHMYGRPGDNLWKQVHARAKYMIALAVLLPFLGGLAIGAGIVRPFWWVNAAFLIMAAGALYIFSEWAGRKVDVLGKERRSWGKGAGGEELVGELLNRLDNQWHVFHGLQPTGDWDFDHVVVGPGGLYSISTKSVRGLFSLAPDHSVLYNNAPIDWVNGARRQAMDMRERMIKVMGEDVPFVNPVLAVPLAYVQFSGPQDHVWVLTQNDLVKVLEGTKYPLSQDQVDRCVQTLRRLRRPSLKGRQ